jgi:diguanylate cyclase (GGDEF)-like protein
MGVLLLRQGSTSIVVARKSPGSMTVLDDKLTVKLDLRTPTPEATRHAVLIVLQGGSIGTSISLDAGSVTIGRGSDCDLRLDDSLASRQHSRIVNTSDDQKRELSLIDLGSTNGTFVNGKLVEDPHVLIDGDKIRVGRHVFKFAWLDAYETEFQEKIEQMIIRDDLTNLLTQRSFFLELERAIGFRSEQPDRGFMCVLMMDLDHFKVVNDTYGHLVGSQTIKQVGELIALNVRERDVAARYGGEEYIAYLQDATRERGLAAAERIREAIEQHSIVVTRKGVETSLKVTISIGVSVYPLDSENPVELIEMADLALYRAKLEGRNRIIGFDLLRDRADSAGYKRLDLRHMLGDAENQADVE